MRTSITSLLILLSISFHSKSQEIMPIENAFDFWIGSWNVSWKNPDGTTTKGTNLITREKNSGVIVEHFDDPTNKFNGISISVFSPADSMWHQAWADNSGGYINMVGKVEGEKRYFETAVEKKGDKTIIRRMVFYNITADSFTWDWELSNDGGKTWVLQWQILYERAK